MSQLRCLKTTEFFFCYVLEVRSMKSMSRAVLLLKSAGEEVSLTLPAPGVADSPWASLDSDASLQSLPLSSHPTPSLGPAFSRLAPPPAPSPLTLDPCPPNPTHTPTRDPAKCLNPSRISPRLCSHREPYSAHMSWTAPRGSAPRHRPRPI